MSERRSRPRAALHQRSDSETNELPASAGVNSLPSNGSHKTPAVSACHPNTTTITVAAKQQPPSNRNTALSSRNLLRPVDSAESLPPVVPLKIKKKISDITVASEPSRLYVPGEIRCSSSNSGTLAASSSATPTPPPPKAQTFPRSILKKPNRPELPLHATELPPYTSEEYRQKTSSWVGSGSKSPSPKRARMNAPTLRIVGYEEEEGTEENGNFQTIWSSQPASPASRGGRNGSYMSRSSSATAPIYPSSKRSSTPSFSSRQFPAWARYFYGKRGGKGLSIIEPEMESKPGSRNGSPEIGIAVFDSSAQLQRQTSDDSMAIAEIIPPPPAVYNPYGSRRTASRSSIPGIDWIGSRTRDPEIATTWSMPHLDHTPLTRFENVDRQLILFCLGFILPICWIVAAFLPLPIPRGSSRTAAPAAIDIESSSSWTVEELRRYENARWWRRINRILSVGGLCVIGAIIALVIVATHVI
ncbi:hypothetical protein RUND412_002458 [Rhizina undulata]